MTWFAAPTAYCPASGLSPSGRPWMGDVWKHQYVHPGSGSGKEKEKRSGENNDHEHLFGAAKFPSEPGGLSRHFYSLMKKSPDLVCCLATESVTKNNKGENLQQKTGGTKLIIECLMANWEER